VLDDGFSITKLAALSVAETAPVMELLITSQFDPVDDAMVHEASPMKNDGHAAHLQVDDREQGGQMEAYFKFNVTGISGPIKKAILQITTADIPFADSDSTGLPHLVSDTTWSEDTVNWMTRPTVHPSPLPNNKATKIDKNKTVTFDLTSAISRNGRYSFALRSGSTDGVVYRAKESGEKKPSLVITWERGNGKNKATSP
jgi:hypothetical protein